MSSQDLEAKIVVLGASGVGKTCLLTRFVHNKFVPPSASAPTVGATFSTKRLVSPDTNPPTVIRLQIWDTAGQERFRSISKLYYRGANAALLCYDITNETSFLEMADWMEELKRNCGDDCIIHVVGTKADVVAEDPRTRKVPFESCIQYVAEQLHGASLQSPQLGASVPSSSVPRDGSMGSDEAFISGLAAGSRSSGVWDQDIVWDSCHEISAKDGDGVEEVFRVLTRKLVEQRMGLDSARRRSMFDGSANAAAQDDSGAESLDGRRRLGTRSSFRLSIGDKRKSWLTFPGSSGGSQTGAPDAIPEEQSNSGRCC